MRFISLNKIMVHQTARLVERAVFICLNKIKSVKIRLFIFTLVRPIVTIKLYIEYNLVTNGEMRK